MMSMRSFALVFVLPALCVSALVETAEADEPLDKAAVDLKVGPLEPWSGKTARRCREVEPIIKKVAARHGIDPGIIIGIIRNESRFKVDARNPRSSATGLMQLLKSTRRRLDCKDPTDAESNVDCGTRLLKGWLKYYKNNLIYALSGYGIGFKSPSAARKRQGLPRNFRFVEKVLRHRVRWMRFGCGEP